MADGTMRAAAAPSNRRQPQTGANRSWGRPGDQARTAQRGGGRAAAAARAIAAEEEVDKRANLEARRRLQKALRESDAKGNADFSLSDEQVSSAADLFQSQLTKVRSI